MFCVLLFILLFCLIVTGILYNVHVKAMTTGIVSDLIGKITDNNNNSYVPGVVYASPPVFTNNFYNDLSLTPEFKTVPLPPTPTPTPTPIKAPDYYYHGNNTQEPQVYHIYNNIYTFQQAEAECMKRKGRLATKSEVTQAYKKGANWCSWGWTSDAHAHMPNRDRKCNASVGVLDAPNVDKKLQLGANCFGLPQ
jgi:hypothetical protein